ncbi:MAG TPA: putative Fe-S cluster assembly protein SufT [Methylomirabilota bacterium]|nr:putative Fe-S cluster assembly protein SufT [Methylomirabilota bacterium]
MHSSDPILLKRDCEAVAIPAGTRLTLPAGSPVRITQSLGGTYTLWTDYGLARVEDKDADALGLEPAAKRIVADADPAAPLDEKLVWDVLKTCYDPEIPVNIVDLGLVYDCTITPAPEGGSNVEVKMTLTAPGCGMGPMIAGDAERKLWELPGVKNVKVHLVWDPPWNQSMMTEAAKLQLGLL